MRIGCGFGVRGESRGGALARELKEETCLSISDVDVLQLGAFGEADRDPRTRVISVAYYALVRPDLIDKVRPGGDAAETAWLDATAELALAFDHNEIVKVPKVRKNLFCWNWQVNSCRFCKSRCCPRSQSAGK